jgi:hypothetical protein
MSAIWTKCVTECHSLLLQSLNVLVEIKDQDVLAEIINSDEGQAKLKGNSHINQQIDIIIKAITCKLML